MPGGIIRETDGFRVRLKTECILRCFADSGLEFVCFSAKILVSKQKTRAKATEA